jgi:hypothetical protein
MSQQMIAHTYRQRLAPSHLSIAISVDDTFDARLAQGLERVGVTIPGTFRWGSESVCASILKCRPAMILLDLPRAGFDELTGLVQAASLIAPVAVLRPGKRNALAAFGAGALDVLDRQAPAAELAVRIHADLRWCIRSAPSRWNAVTSASQGLLFDVISRAQAPVCCHHLRLLLGTPSAPMSLRALKARIQRLQPAFADSGLVLVEDRQWGLTTYRAREPDSQATRVR